MAREFDRIQRIESLIQTELAKMIELSFKDASSFMITLTGVKVSKDLSYAKVYVVGHNDEKAKEMIDALNKEAKSFRYQLGKSIKLRKLPELHFYYDEVIVRGDRIAKLLNDVDLSDPVS